MAVTVVVLAVIVAAAVAFYVWQRRISSDVDFAELQSQSMQTDEERRAKQIGIALTSTNQIGNL